MSPEKPGRFIDERGGNVVHRRKEPRVIRLFQIYPKAAERQAILLFSTYA
jgi:hypothetical protein